MGAQRIGIETAILAITRIDRNYGKLSEQISSGKAINSPKDDPARWSQATASRNAYGSLQAINNGLNEVARNVKVADKSMESIGKIIGAMKGQLDFIVKNFPPYPPGSTQRADLLNSFNALRQQIDQLTYPPKDEGARRIMADPAAEPLAGDWQVVVGDNGVTKIIHQQEVHTGATGLNIPALPTNADDTQIAAAMANLETASSTLSLRRATLSAESAGLSRSLAFNSKLAESYRGQADEIETTSLPDDAALLKSLELRNQLAVQSVKSITDTESELLALLR
jgi:flagellin-like hook-associated protein FlgL